MNVRRRLSMLLAPVLALAAFGALGSTGIAGAADHWQHTSTCTGTLTKPGVLTGRHQNVVVIGACEVNAGRAEVRGNLVIAPGGVLVAAFALNDTTHSGHSSLTVGGSVTVQRGGTAVLGCEAAHFPCVDDPNPTAPTLNSSTQVGGNLDADNALGVLVHHSSVAGNVQQNGGGGGVQCVPQGVFALFKAPVYSDYEDNAIGGNLSVAGVGSCWFGALRDNVHGNLSASHNTMADPDANEVLTNLVHGNIACFGNSPAVQYGDSHGMPNRVAGSAAGQCGFHVLKPDPAPNGPLMHISVRI